MGWETRNGHRYYYRKARIGRRVVSEYVGGGLLGYISHMMDDEVRKERRVLVEQHRQAQREQIQAMREDDQRFERTLAVLRAAATALLDAEGVHNHRGQWRRKRT